MKRSQKRSTWFGRCSVGAGPVSPRWGTLLLWWLVSLVPLLDVCSAAADETAHEFFEKEIRPIFVTRCLECHGEVQTAGLLLASRQNLLKGGESGPAIVPGKPEASLLIQAVRHEVGMEMPPDQKLSEREINALVHWVKIGAPWSETDSLDLVDPAEQAKTHWAFQPIREPDIPEVRDDSWPRTPIDAFVLARLAQHGLAPSPEADRRTLIRRASYALTGLPPRPEEVAAFVNDSDPRAYERLVDRLLESPQYGEKWARHWLDVARYSDTKGYVYAREERFWVHAWTYRDWVVQALNEDVPYDRFLLLQLAADQVDDRTQSDLAAMGFLTVGRRFLGVKHDIIDDRIDVVTRGMLGLSVSCARCHDHKYDPIPTADYYSLYGVFDSCAEQTVPLSDASVGDEDYQAERQARREKLLTKLAESRAESSARVRQRIGDYLQAQTRLDEFPDASFGQIRQKDDLLPAFVRRWEAYLDEADRRGRFVPFVRSSPIRNRHLSSPRSEQTARGGRRGDPVFVPWHAFRQLSADSFAREAEAVIQSWKSSGETRVHPLVAETFAVPPQSFDEVIDRYAELFADIDARWSALLAEAEEQGHAPPEQLPEAEAEELRRVLYGPGSPCEVPDEPIVHTESYFDSATRTELWKLQGELDRWIIRAPVDDPWALTLVDRPVPVEPRIFRRGNPLNTGERVPRQFLAFLSGDDRQPFQQGSGRLELAREIIQPDNPLTARVIVSRVWAQHFGQGLVTTPSDFGVRAEPPSHPELLDWLAARFVAEGWSLKQLHRWILLSATFRQSSRGPDDPELRRRAEQTAPANRPLWRMNPHRLTFEEIRDSLLAVSGQLDSTIGGKPEKLFEEPFSKRRTLYGLVDRQFFPSTMRIFDFANPDLHIPKRSETTVPQQTLFFFNHPLVLEQARRLAAAAQERATEPGPGVRYLFHQAFQREPTETEVTEAITFITEAEQTPQNAERVTVADWQYGYGALDEQEQAVTGFTSLPHFTGQAWQGGPKWPDPQLGWVQLTAQGGHPGNDRQHAAIRRWTAPRPMNIVLRSQLTHEPAPGDGVRAFIVSSRRGVLQSAQVHQQDEALNVDGLTVEAGETIDFVVDIGEVLNSDQYEWTVTIAEPPDSEEQSDSDGAQTWDSTADFTPDTVRQLTPWEQLAHVLLLTNEFLFVE